MDEHEKSDATAFSHAWKIIQYSRYLEVINSVLHLVKHWVSTLLTAAYLVLQFLEPKCPQGLHQPEIEEPVTRLVSA